MSARMEACLIPARAHRLLRVPLLKDGHVRIAVFHAASAHLLRVCHQFSKCLFHLFAFGTLRGKLSLQVVTLLPLVSAD